jgi:hypothetical protein
MQDIIVLGMIPGTNLVLTFNEWLMIIGLLVVLLKLFFKPREMFFKINLYLSLIYIIYSSKITRYQNQQA